MSKNSVDVSIIVPAYNSVNTIADCLDALLAQNTHLQYEVIVVESSNDGTCELIRERFPQVKLIASNERLFSGAARNKGAEEAHGELIGFVDSDCIVESTWLSKMWLYHFEYDCSVVGGSILNGNPESSFSVSSYINEFSDFFSNGKPRYKHYLPTGNITYKASVFRSYGGFNPDERLYVDLIFNTALSRAGEKLLFAPEIRVLHMHRDTFSDYFSHETKRGQSAAIARRKGLMIGSSWTQYPALAVLVTPGLFLRKAAVFPFRFLRAYPNESIKLFKALPTFYIALAFWHYGFLKEIFTNKQPSQKEGTARCAKS